MSFEVWKKEEDRKANEREEARQRLLNDALIPDARRIEIANSQQVIYRDVGGGIKQVGQILGPNH